MADIERTTKYVTLTVKAVFYGDYVDADETTARVQDWIDVGLNDRDDLRSWEFGEAEVSEVPGDPEGYGS